LNCARQEILNLPYQHYDFEDVLDECGFKFHEELAIPNSEMQSKARLWEIIFTDSSEL
jgi:hypothetical protein